MKVKIRNSEFSPEKYPIMITLTEEDKKIIQNMPKDATRFAQFPEDWGIEEAKAWMDNPGIPINHFAVRSK